MILLRNSTTRLKNYEKANYHFDVILGNDIIGVVVVHHFGCGMSYMYNLAYIEIFESFQRKGYGSQVLKQLIERFHQLALFSKPNIENFYLKNGFNKLSEEGFSA